VDGHDCTRQAEALANLLERGLGMPVHITREPLNPLAPQGRGLTHGALAWGQAALTLPLPLEFVHPPFADFEARGDLAHCPLLLIIGLHHSLA
jgi:hypothetical protein